MNGMLTRMLAAWLVLAPSIARGEPLATTWVRFTSLDGPQTVLDGYLLRPAAPGQHPAVVLLHGCAGLIGPDGILPRERDWAERLSSAGYLVLMVDSFVPRHAPPMCVARTADPAITAARSYDAYAALLYLQMQPDVISDRISLIGWSDGGGAVLETVRPQSAARPAYLPNGDFRAAVAFYPDRCANFAQAPGWGSVIPLLVLVGDSDLWTPAPLCRALITKAAASGSRAEIVIYPLVYHDFDWPDLTYVRRIDYTTAAGVVPVLGTDMAARADALRRVTQWLTDSNPPASLFPPK